MNNMTKKISKATIIVSIIALLTTTNTILYRELKATQATLSQVQEQSLVNAKAINEVKSFDNNLEWRLYQVETSWYGFYDIMFGPEENTEK